MIYILSDILKDYFFYNSYFSGDELDDGEVSVTVSTTKNEDGSITNSPVSTLSSIKGIEPLAQMEWREHGLSSWHILFISIVWKIYQCLGCSCCAQSLFLEMSHLILTTMDMIFLHFHTDLCLESQRYFMICIWNQNHFSPCWVFSHTIPLLIPCKIRKKVKFNMKDGDAQQQNEILKALKEVFPNSIEGWCRWQRGRFAKCS